MRKKKKIAMKIIPTTTPRTMMTVMPTVPLQATKTQIGRNASERSRPRLLLLREAQREGVEVIRAPLRNL
jgi:hypothetical protein